MMRTRSEITGRPSITAAAAARKLNLELAVVASNKTQVAAEFFYCLFFRFSRFFLPAFFFMKGGGHVRVTAAAAGYSIFIGYTGLY